MPQKTTNETCRLELTCRQANQAVIGMTEMAVVETRITSEESHLPYPVQQ